MSQLFSLNFANPALPKIELLFSDENADPSSARRAYEGLISFSEVEKFDPLMKKGEEISTQRYFHVRGRRDLDSHCGPETTVAQVASLLYREHFYISAKLKTVEDMQWFLDERLKAQRKAIENIEGQMDCIHDNS